MYKSAQDISYVRFLRRLHKMTTVDWYLEIGSRHGDSAEPVRSKTILVDPFFRITTNVIGQKPAFMAFQQTSDEFFASGVLSALGAKLSFAFLDGMHLFEYLLRDFMNTEAQIHPGGAIAMHDCCPYNSRMTTRDLENLPKGAWTGDVWKIIPILQKYRPDLQIDVYGCKPTGLVIVRNLDPGNDVLRRNYDEIVRAWESVEIEEYGPDRFYGSFEYASARQAIADRFSFLDAVKLDDAAQAAPKWVTP